PPRSQRPGGFSPVICLAQASLAQATCFTCSPNERTPLNSPCDGLNDHLSSGMASARAVKSFSMLFQIKLIESGMFFGSAGRCCAIPATGFMSSAAPTSTIEKFFMALSHFTAVYYLLRTAAIVILKHKPAGQVEAEITELVRHRHR